MNKHFVFAVLILSLLLLPVLISEAQVPDSFTGSKGTQYVDQALSLLSTQDMISLSSLNALTQGQSSVISYENVIQQHLLSLNIRTVLLDIGWQNYSIGSIPYQSWVDNWLSASDGMGVQNVFYVGQLTQGGINSVWVDSLLQADPGAGTYYSNGRPANYISLDNPDVARALEGDLSILYSYYGNHTSWVGLGTGYSNNDPYYSSNSSMPVLGYSNYSIANFVNSPLYQHDVNSTGYNQNGSLDKLWASFKNVNQTIVLSSGNWWTSSAVQTSGQNFVIMEFYLPKNETTIHVKWYGDRVGNPGNLTAKVYNASGKGVRLSGSPVSQQNQTYSSISNSAGWQGPVDFSGNFSAGYNWILFSSSGDSQNHYDVYLGDYQIGDTLAGQIPSLSSTLPTSRSSILWITDRYGATLSLNPYHTEVVSTRPTQTFVANSSFSFNTVFLFLSDRHLNPTNGTIEVIDQSQNNKLVATGTLSEALTHGIQEWTSIILQNTVTTVKGNTYELELTEPNGGYSWLVVNRGLETSPTFAGFQNQSQYWLFELGISNWGQSHLDFTSMTTNGRDAVNSGQMDAVGFEPSKSEILQSFQILVSNPGATIPNEITLSVRQGTLAAKSCAYGPPCSFGTPSQTVLKAVSLNGSMVSSNGWLNVTGLDIPVADGNYYWIAFSSNSSQPYPFARLVSPYNLPVLVSEDGGNTWTYSGEGPTEYSCIITLSGERIGNPVDKIPNIGLTPSVYFAEPFVASTSGQVDGVSLGPIARGSTEPSSRLLVSINPDNGRGEPSLLALASGVLYGNNITLPYSLQFIHFSSAARIQPGQKYWLVVQPIYGNFAVFPAIYSEPDADSSANLSALITRDSGFGWGKISNNTVSVSFILATTVESLPNYDTSQIFQSLSQNHNNGWNTYNQYSELSTYHQVVSWLSDHSSRNFSFYTSNDMQDAASLQYSDLVTRPPMNSTSTCEELASYFLEGLPLQGQQYHDASGLSLLASCKSPNLGQLAVQLGYMKYVGTNFGLSSGLSVLVVGDGASSNLTNYLRAAFNATYVQIDSATNLTQVLESGNYSSVVWMAQNSSSDSLQGLENYTNGGGELIIAEKPPAWMSGFTSSVANNNSQIVANSSLVNAQQQLDMALNHTDLSLGLRITSASSSGFMASSPNLIFGTADYGLGKVVLLETSTPVADAAQVSSYTILLSNVISDTNGSTSPFWYGNNVIANSQAVYGIMGEKGGPVLVWLSNPSNNSLNMSLELDARFYSFTNDWESVYPLQIQGSAGNGSTVMVSASIPPNDWTAVYIIPNSTQLTIRYSNVNVVRQEVFPGQGFYVLAGSKNQSALAVISSKTGISGVVTDSSNLTRLSSASSLVTSSEGWYFNNRSDTLFLKYLSNGTDSIRVFQIETTSPTGNWLTTAAIYTLAALISIEIAALAYAKIIRKAGRHQSSSSIRMHRIIELVTSSDRLTIESGNPFHRR